MELCSGRKIRSNSTPSLVTIVSMASENQFSITPEVLENLARIIAESTRVQGQTNVSVLRGNYAKCTTRFNGLSTSDVESFIDSILVYKDCVEILDENALKGL